MAKVKLFTTPACVYCVTVKEFLKEKNVQFEEIDVSQDEKLKDEIIEKSGQMGVPVLDVDGEMVAGFDRKKICQLLKLEE